MATPAQSILCIQGDTKTLNLTHETTFGDYSATLLIGKRRDGELVDLVKEIEMDVSGSAASGSFRADMAPGLYESQLILTDNAGDEDESAIGPMIVVKARIGGWPESPSP